MRITFLGLCDICNLLLGNSTWLRGQSPCTWTHQRSRACLGALATAALGWRQTAPDTGSRSSSPSGPHRWRHWCSCRSTPSMVMSMFAGRSGSATPSAGPSRRASLTRGFRLRCTCSCDVVRWTWRWRWWRWGGWGRPDSPQWSQSAGRPEPSPRSLSWPRSRRTALNLRLYKSCVLMFYAIFTTNMNKSFIIIAINKINQTKI